MTVQDVYGPVEELETLLQKAAQSFTKNYPVMKGGIEAVNKQEITINLGAQDGIKEFSLFSVYRESPPFRHPVTNRIIESDPEIIGTLSITSVEKETATGKIITGNMAISPFDKVISK